MLKKVVLPAIACLIITALLLPWRPGQAQQAPARYFPQTGHYLGEPFRSTFETKGDLQLWGPPITEAFEENGRLVQYFQRARMECLAEPQGPCEVRLSPLGELLGERTPRTPPVPEPMISDGLCQYFTETGHNVCFSFLTFYLDHGGPDTLGPPISEPTIEPGMLTQYFRYARIEWHMDAPPDTPMRLGAIGQEHFHAKGLDPTLLLPVESTPVSYTGAQDINVGDYVRVGDTGGVGLRLRSGPGLGRQPIEMLGEGTTLRVVGGPEHADGFTWWYLDYRGSLGWCAGEWLERTEAPGSP